MVAAPLVVLLYDRTFCSGSVRSALVGRRGYSLVLALTWLPLIGLVVSTGADRGGTFAFTAELARNYWLVQSEAIARTCNSPFGPRHWYLNTG